MKDTVTEELLESKGEAPRSTEDEDLLTTTRGSAIVSTAYLFEQQGVEMHQTGGQVQVRDVEGQMANTDDSDNNFSGGGENTAVGSQKCEDATATSSRSFPLHMRPDFKTPTSPQPSTSDARVSFCDLG